MNQVDTAVVAPAEEEKTLELRKPVKLAYRLHIAIALASLASTLASLYWWYPYP